MLTVTLMVLGLTVPGQGASLRTRLLGPVPTAGLTGQDAGRLDVLVSTSLACQLDDRRLPDRPGACRRSGVVTATVVGVSTLVRFALRVVVLAVIIYVVSQYFVSGITVTANPEGTFGETGTFLWVALLFAVVNSIVGPVIRLLALPFVVLTLGLFLLVVNAALLGITAAISDRLQVDGFWTAIVGGFLIAVFSWIAELVLPLKVRD